MPENSCLVAKLSFSKFFSYFMCIGVWPAWMSVQCLYIAHGGQKKRANLPEQEL